MLAIIWTIVIGFVVGLIARALHPGNDKLSLIWTTILGVGGSFLANYIGAALNWYKDGENAGFIASTIGAIVLLALYSLYQRKKNQV